MRFTLPIAILSGLAAAVLFVAAATPGAGPFGLFLSLLIAPLPIAVAGFGWGWTTALGGLIVGSLVLIPVSAPVGIAAFAVVVALPMVVSTYLLSLNRDWRSDDGQIWVQWYPIGHVLVAVAVWSALVATAGVIMIGGDLETLTAQMRATLERFFAAQTQLPDGVRRALTPEEMDRLAAILARMTPGALSIGLFFISSFSLWLGASIAARSGRLQRPWPDFATIVLPRIMPLMFAAAAGLSFADGLTGLIASGFAWSLFLVYMLVGIAMVHQLTRGQALRLPALIAMYFAVFFLNPYSGFILAMAALAEPIWPFKRRQLEDAPQPVQPGPPPGTPPSGHGPGQGPGAGPGQANP